MKSRQPSAALISPMSEDVIVASFNVTELTTGDYSDPNRKDEIAFEDLVK